MMTLTCDNIFPEHLVDFFGKIGGGRVSHETFFCFLIHTVSITTHFDRATISLLNYISLASHLVVKSKNKVQIVPVILEMNDKKKLTITRVK